jgi:tetratricopeptide (TPR) repeat protein
VAAITTKTTGTVRAATQKSTPSSTLSITTTHQASRKGELLMQAYQSYERGDMAAARVAYDKVLMIDGENRDGLLGRAAIHVQDNEYQQAIDKYQQLLEQNPKDTLAMASLISVANIDPKTGESRLKSLLREQPDSAYLHFALGNMYGGQQRWNEAQNEYFKALSYGVGDPNYAYNLAVSLDHMGQKASAVKYYQKALNNSTTGLITFDPKLVSERMEVLSR